MVDDRSRRLRLSWTAGDSISYVLTLAALLFIGLLWSNPASAQQCPSFNITVPHGGSMTEPHCNIGGFLGFNPIGSIPPGELPQHGTLTIDTLADTFTYTHNGDAATTDFFRIRDTDNVPIDVTVTISPPTSTITITPGALSLQAGAPFSQQLAATGGVGSYTFSLDAGSLPPGLSLSAGGLISGTPTQRGNYNFTVRATDSTSASGLQSYAGSTANPSLTLAPTSSQAPLGSTFSVTYTPAGGVGPYTASLAPGDTLPPGLNLSGFTLSGTPTTLGNYSFQIVVQDSSTGPGNWFQFLTVAVNVVVPLPTVSSVTPNTGLAAGGTSVTITGTGLTGATAVTFGGVAATGVTVINDTTVTATTPAHAAGAVAVAVTAPGGTASLPNGFTYAAPMPTAASHTLQLGAGASGTVNLTDGATGGPFTAAAIVTSPPTSDGTASIVQNGAQWQLVYASALNAASTVIVRYTLSNASGTSAPSTVTFTVVARPDPSRDREVIGLLNAQAQSANRFARSQITNFRDRLEQLHDDSSREATSMNVRLGAPQDPVDQNALGYARETSPYDPIRNALAYAPNDTRNPRQAGKTPPPKSETPSDLAFWTGGFINFGTTNRYNVGLGHTLIGVSGGVDYRFSPGFTAGIGFGYGRDSVDVGNNTTRSNGQSLSTAIYGSYHPRNNAFIDALLGYSALDFGSSRFVTPTSGTATGDRSGNQVFGSIISGYEYKSSRLLVSPYGRMEAAWTQLNAFTESGAASYDLAFGKQTLSMLAGVVGMRAEYAFLQDWGVLKARGRLEYTHDFTGSSLASMGYADLKSGLPYTLGVNVFTRNYIATGVGFDAPIGNGATLGFDYTTALGFEGRTEIHNFVLRLGAKF